MWCDTKTTQLVHSNLYFISVFTFSVSYGEYRNMHRIAMYQDISYHDQSNVMRIVSVLDNTQPLGSMLVTSLVV